MALPLHISRLDYPQIYEPAFGNEAVARAFVERVEAATPGRNTALVILHQTARMVWLGDQIATTIAAGRPAFQILFYLIAAEAAAKLLAGYTGDSQSRRFVRGFFEELCDSGDQNILAHAFFAYPHTLSLRQAVDLLYDVRCDVVHAGGYFQFHLARRGDTTATLSLIPDKAHIRKSDTAIESITTSLTAEDLRRIVLRGAAAACERALAPPG